MIEITCSDCIELPAGVQGTRYLSSMKISVKHLRKLIRETLEEFGGPSGGLRRVRGGSGQQHKIGKVEEENKQLSTFEAEELFPGSTDAWTEIVPELFPDFPFDDPMSIKKHSMWFKIGSQLRVAFEEMPQLELASWDPEREDWIELEHGVPS